MLLRLSLWVAVAVHYYAVASEPQTAYAFSHLVGLGLFLQRIHTFMCVGAVGFKLN